MIEHSKNGITYFTFERLAVDGIDHAVFSRVGGVSSAPFNGLNLSSAQPDNKEDVAQNQALAYGVFDRGTADLVHVNLIHTANVVRVSKADHGRCIPDCDGLITNDPGCGLTMNYADCGSVVLYDPIKKVIALGHAGWRGSVADLPGALVRSMQEEFGCEVTDILAGLGPCISPSHYEVDEPLISQVHEAFPKWTDRLLSYPTNESGEVIGRPYFNLALANHIRLYEAGVKEVEFPDICTASRTDLFFSHRAENGKTGRFGVAVLLK